MAIIDIFLIIASISLVVIVAALVPVLTQFKKTALCAESTLMTLNNDLAPLLAKVAESTDELQVLTASLNEKIEKTDLIIDTVQQAGNTLLETSTVVKNTVIPVIAQIGGISTGIAAFRNFFIKKETSKGRYSDEQ